MSDEQDAALQSPLVGALNRLAAALERMATVEEIRWIGPAAPVTAQRGRQAKRGQGGFRRRYEGYGDGSRRRW